VTQFRFVMSDERNQKKFLDELVCFPLNYYTRNFLINFQVCKTMCCVWNGEVLNPEFVVTDEPFD